MRKSTGPRTPRGKARSSRNAAKHWIESGRILPEEQKEAAILRSGLEEDFKPQGLIEQDFIDDFVFNRLIKRRIDVAFTREFLKAPAETQIKVMDREDRSASGYWYRLEGLGNGYRTERERAERLPPSLCIVVLEDLQGRIRDRGVKPSDLAILRAAYGDQPTGSAARAMHALLHVAEKEPEQDKTAGTRDDAAIKKGILEALETEIRRQEVRKELATRMFNLECASGSQEPPAAALETLLRYRAANTRESVVLLENLERARRLRRSTT